MITGASRRFHTYIIHMTGGCKKERKKSKSRKEERKEIKKEKVNWEKECPFPTWRTFSQSSARPMASAAFCRASFGFQSCQSGHKPLTRTQIRQVLTIKKVFKRATLIIIIVFLNNTSCLFTCFTYVYVYLNVCVDVVLSFSLAFSLFSSQNTSLGISIFLLFVFPEQIRLLYHFLREKRKWEE